MSSRAKRKLDFDPNASDPNDSDFDDTERPAPQRRQRNRARTGAKSKGNKRQRRTYAGSDVDDDDDDIVSDNSFTERSSSEEIEINPATGRSVRRAARKEIKYEESDEDAIEDTPSEDEEGSPVPRRSRKARQEKPSLIVKLKLPKGQPKGRPLRNRTGSKSTMRGKTPEVTMTRRSSRLSHDVEEPIIALTGSGKHVEVVRKGTRSPEPVITRATRGGKGPRVQQPSAIMEASQETSTHRDEDTPGPLDKLLGGDDAEVKASTEGSPEHQAQDPDAEEDKDVEMQGDTMEGVVEESQQEHSEESDEEGPVTRGGRNLRVCDEPQSPVVLH